MKANRITLATELDSLSLVGADSGLSDDTIREINRLYTEDCVAAIRERTGVQRVTAEYDESGLINGGVAVADCYNDHDYNHYAASREREEDLATIRDIIDSIDVNAIINSIV